MNAVHKEARNTWPDFADSMLQARWLLMNIGALMMAGYIDNYPIEVELADGRWATVALDEFLRDTVILMSLAQGLRIAELPKELKPRAMSIRKARARREDACATLGRVQ
jgi:hypothetical protein